MGVRDCPFEGDGPHQNCEYLSRYFVSGTSYGSKSLCISRAIVNWTFAYSRMLDGIAFEVLLSNPIIQCQPLYSDSFLHIWLRNLGLVMKRSSHFAQHHAPNGCCGVKATGWHSRMLGCNMSTIPRCRTLENTRSISCPFTSKEYFSYPVQHMHRSKR